MLKSALVASQNKIDAWRLVNNRGFRLTQFTTTYHDSQAWNSQFWEDQSEIRLLSIPNFSGFPYRVPGTPRLLPNLVALEARPEAIPTVKRSLKHVQLHLCRTRDLDGMNSLYYHATTLRTLSILCQGIKNISTFDVVSKAAALLPDLRHLNITEYKESVRAPAKMLYLG
jgi:hypothetical protein